MKAKYQLDTAENREFLHNLCNKLLRFGHKFPSPDGSTYYLDGEGNPWVERNRETYATGRMVHVYSIGTMLGHDGSE